MRCSGQWQARFIRLKPALIFVFFLTWCTCLLSECKILSLVLVSARQSRAQCRERELRCKIENSLHKCVSSIHAAVFPSVRYTHTHMPPRASDNSDQRSFRASSRRAKPTRQSPVDDRPAAPPPIQSGWAEDLKAVRPPMPPLLLPLLLSLPAPGSPSLTTDTPAGRRWRRFSQRRRRRARAGSSCRQRRQTRRMWTSARAAPRSKIPIPTSSRQYI